jgi:hypothetical protein
MSEKSTDITTIDNSILTLERLFTAEEFKVETFGPARWLKWEPKLLGCLAMSCVVTGI